MRKLSNPLLKIVNNIENNHYSDISNIKIKELAVLNKSYNDLHTKLNKEIDKSKIIFINIYWIYNLLIIRTLKNITNL